MWFWPFFIAFVLFGVWAYRSDRRDEREWLAKCNAESAAWLEMHRDLARWKVLVFTKSGNQFETEPFEPSSEVAYFFRGYEVTNESSQFQAKRFTEKCMKQGYYQHEETNIYVPMCEIGSMQVVVDRS